MRTFDCPVPDRIAKLPTDPRGYPVPWFVAWVDGKPHFPVMDQRKLLDALRNQRCWVCGETLGSYKAYTIGPMCAVNRTSAEPPSHRDCAIFAARACPFLNNPKMGRKSDDAHPEGTTTPDQVPGIMIECNPGVTLVWVIKGKVRTKRDPRGGLLFDIGEPVETLWYAHGRDATRAEVVASIDSGIPLLREHCQGPRDHAALDQVVDRAMTLVPAA